MPRLLKISALLVCMLHGSRAVGLPDAGEVYRQVPNRLQPPAPTPERPPRLESQVGKPARPGGGEPANVTFTVSRLAFEGISVFPADELSALAQDFMGRPITFAELGQAIARIEARYRQAGYLIATAFIPPQEVRDGIVQVRVYEGRISAIEVRPLEGVRLDTSLVERMVRQGLPGEILQERELESALLRVNAIPGIRARVVVQRGALEGTAKLVVLVAEEKALSLTVAVHNGANRYSGGQRADVQAQWTDPSGAGDLMLLNISHSQGSDFARGTYWRPLGVRADRTLTHPAD